MSKILTANGQEYDSRKIEISTKVSTCGVIEHQVAGLQENVMAFTVRTMEKATRESLIRLGWTPPSEGFVPETQESQDDIS